MLFWYGCLGWRLYLATVDGLPAGVAVLYFDGEIGYLPAAATVPAYRGRGCHLALVRARLADAAEAGCKLVAAQAPPLSAGARNLQRAGLKLAYCKAIWSGSGQ
jgi:GNAT superfamily N-acetyltransferase